MGGKSCLYADTRVILRLGLQEEIHAKSQSRYGLVRYLCRL